MHFKIGAILMVATLSLVGCTNAIQGTAMMDPKGICKTKGFEDLRADDPGCGKYRDLKGAVPDAESARDVTIDGHTVPYLIEADGTQNDYAGPVDLTTLQVRPYPHAMIFAVLRFENMDVVRIVASDTCSVEKWYDETLDKRPDRCVINNVQLSGKSISADDAASVITKPLVDRLEIIAGDAKRFTNYELILADNP